MGLGKNAYKGLFLGNTENNLNIMNDLHNFSASVTSVSQVCNLVKKHVIFFPGLLVEEDLEIMLAESLYKTTGWKAHKNHVRFFFWHTLHVLDLDPVTFFLVWWWL